MNIATMHITEAVIAPATSLPPTIEAFVFLVRFLYDGKCFHITTIEASTTIPIAIAKADNEEYVCVYPAIYKKMKVAIRETGMEVAIIREEQTARNNKITRITKFRLSKRVAQVVYRFDNLVAGIQYQSKLNIGRKVVFKCLHFCKNAFTDIYSISP